MADNATIESATKLNQLAYRRFKEALFSKRIQAGSTVSQADLVAITGVPVGPLREAMQVLESEGLIRILPRSGIQIVKPDLLLVRNAFQLRQILERPAVRAVAEAMSKEELLRLRSGHLAMRDRVEGSEPSAELAEEVRLVDYGFHLQVIRFLSNPLLERAYLQAYDRIRLIRLDQLYMLSSAAITRTMHEHLAIVDACLARSPEAAEQALDHHFGKAMQRALGL